MLRRLLLAAAALVAGVAAQEDNVLVLTESNFHSNVGKDKPAFVEFYAPWCGHCKNLAPAWASLADTFKPADGVLIAKVDATENGELASKFGVQGYPTIKWFPAGSLSPEDYNGGRDVEDLVSFVNGKTGMSKKVKVAPSAVAALDTTTFDAVVGQPGVHKLVEFYAPWCGHCKALAPTWEKLGAVFEGESSVVIAKVDADKHGELGQRFGVKGFPTIKYIPASASGSKTEDAAEDYNGGRSLDDLVSFINKKAGTARASSGGLLPSAGRIAALDAIAAGFASAADKAAEKKKAEAVAAGLTGADAAAADRYLKVMGKVLEKGAGYVAEEAGRVARMLANEGVKKEKKTEMALKKNVLDAFAGVPAAAGGDADL